MKIIVRSFVVFIFLISIVSSLYAQSASTGTVTGTVTDSKSNKPVDFATVALVKRSDNKTVKAAQTDLQGNFRLENIPFDTYTLKISFVGYEPFAKENITLTAANPNYDAATVKLNMSATNVLQEVVVQSERSAIQLGLDRKVFSVKESLVSEGGTATDLLANVPSVSVDIDGNVSLRGADNVRVLIDGKPSAIGGGNIANILQSLPASAIESIELITNPSSKYDPEGQSGIINIVLKKNRKIGLNGSLSLTAGSYDSYNASSNLSYRDTKVNLYGNYSYRTGNRVGGGFNNTTYLNSDRLINNNTDSRRENSNHTFKLGSDFYLNPKTTIGVSGNVSLRNGESNEGINYLYENIPDISGSSLRTTVGEDTDEGYDLNLDFTRQFKRKGENLTANFQFGQDKEDGSERFNQNFYTPAGVIRDTVDRRITDNKEFTTNYNFQVDYTLPFTERQKLEAGYRTTIRNDEESQFSESFDPSQNRFQPDVNLTNDFFLDDIVHAVYTNYQNQLTDKFGFQVGLRAEQAYLNTNYVGLNSGSVKGKLDYLRLYPSLFITNKMTEDQQLQLSYTRRVNRPRGWQVNPFMDIDDPNNIRVGNPNLRPEDIHSFELSYIKYWNAFTLTSSAYFRQVNDVVQSIRSLVVDYNINNPANAINGIADSSTIMQFFNLSKNRASGLELIARADIVKGFNLTGNVNLYHTRFEGNPQYKIQSRSGFNWNANLTGNLQLPNNISAQFNTHYMAPRVSPQGRTREMFGLDAGLRYDFMKNKAAAISLNMRDVFNTRRWAQYTETVDLIQESERRFQGRMFNLTLSYRFGKQDLNQRSRKREQQQDEPREEEESFK
ncbi:MAG TPA: TonB-dependent receptor [Sphingobacteriaceae bacterium]